jgi:hypothetical protein
VESNLIEVEVPAFRIAFVGPTVVREMVLEVHDCVQPLRTCLSRRLSNVSQEQFHQVETPGSPVTLVDIQHNQRVGENAECQMHPTVDVDVNFYCHLIQKSHLPVILAITPTCVRHDGVAIRTSIESALATRRMSAIPIVEGGCGAGTAPLGQSVETILLLEESARSYDFPMAFNSAIMSLCRAFLGGIMICAITDDVSWNWHTILLTHPG